jgi:hypothetical protein
MNLEVGFTAGSRYEVDSTSIIDGQSVHVPGFAEILQGDCKSDFVVIFVGKYAGVCARVVESRRGISRVVAERKR